MRPKELQMVVTFHTTTDAMAFEDAAKESGLEGRLIPIDMQKYNISALCCSGHKSLLGPQGTGVLCLAKGVKPTPLKFGGTGMDSFSHTMPDVLPTSLESGTLYTL